MLVAAGDQGEEQGGGLRGEGDVADLVTDQQRDTPQPLQLAAFILGAWLWRSSKPAKAAAVGVDGDDPEHPLRGVEVRR